MPLTHTHVSITKEQSLSMKQVKNKLHRRCYFQYRQCGLFTSRSEVPSPGSFFIQHNRSLKVCKELPFPTENLSSLWNGFLWGKLTSFFKTKWKLSFKRRGGLEEKEHPRQRDSSEKNVQRWGWFPGTAMFNLSLTANQEGSGPGHQSQVEKNEGQADRLGFTF